MRKETSTNTLNRERLQQDCGISYTLSRIGGRWKINIVSFLLSDTVLRYGELKQKLPGISERMLIAQLKELESDGLVLRTVYPQVPPKVEYSLTAKGKSLQDIIKSLSDWGELHR